MKQCEECGASCHEVGNGRVWTCTDCNLVHVSVRESEGVRVVR